jgi:vitamin B12 transporter
MKPIITAFALAAACAGGAAAQQPSGDAARAALAQCIAYAEGSEEQQAKKDEAKAAYENAKKMFKQLVSAQPDNADAHAGLGETISRCGIPLANMMSIMGVVEESTASLEKALKLDPRHWQARFVLAMNNFHMPAFLNRIGTAIEHLEKLQQQQGNANDRPHYAMTYLFLGDAYKKANRDSDAQAAWAAGARLFPDNVALQQRVKETTKQEESAVVVVTSNAELRTPDTERLTVLTPLRVDAAQHQLDDARAGTSLKRIDVYTMPGGTGEMLQTLQSLPGATRAGDGADLYVRGGDPEETPVFVNGGRLAFPGRWESLNGSTMGVLDANVLSKAYFSAGGFSAKYGNALSGVVDVEATGRPAEARGRIGANMVSLGGSLFRPVGASSGAWGTFMLTDVRLVAATQGQTDMYPDMPQSYQAVVGGASSITSQLEVKALALAAGDRSARMVDVGGYHGAFASAGSTQHAALSARWLASDARSAVNASITASRRAGGFDFGVLARDRTDAAYGARIDGDRVLTSGARVRTGIELGSFAATTAGSVPATGNLEPGSPVHVLGNENADATHAGAYLEVEQGFGALAVVAGARADRLPGEEDVKLDPRVALAYTAGGWTMRAGGGVFHQGRWRRTYRLPDSGTPGGVPTRARHVVIGTENAGEPAVRVEAYTKLYDGFTADDDGVLDISAATTRGIDAMVRWQRQERLNGWVTYSMMDAELELLDGATAPARFDVTHTLTGVGRFALTDDWELGSTIRYATGKPYTPVVGTREPAQQGWPLAPVFGDANSERLPDYFRVDGRITRYARLGANRTGVFYLEMLDLNGRANVLGYQYDATYTIRKPVESFFARRTFVLGAELAF